MASETTTFIKPPSSATPRGWWSRPIATLPAKNDREATCEECAAYCSPCYGGLFTVIVVFSIFSSINNAHFHAKISIQSMAISSGTWQVDFLVEDTSPSYSIYYDADDAAVKLGPRNVACLNITRSLDDCRDQHRAAFSLFFVAEEGNRSVVVSEELDIKLRAEHKRYVNFDEAGHINIRCKNLTRGLDEKIICQSYFTELKKLHIITEKGRISDKSEDN
ncbi:unnamed protein product [Microthlaspi erraticum]|uniref:Late embryogenesis abundant protein LEA-2 subgroup domain-containing protein n=1 Tax=Microthlaspi erraticum TaxID=1685480 RepID=A0A6D2LEX9_9BRAS|nr:unnamed protein product [Microthlaspi erraticum]CAA7058708.1 unnamed protein product [Microthlaspi erraticum]